MRKAEFFFTLVLLFCPAYTIAQGNLLQSANQAKRTTPDYPVVTFAYADLYDRFCSDATKLKIDPTASAEVQTRVGEFQEAWNREGPTLLRTVPKITGAAFDFSEVKGALSICNPGSLSFPLIFDVRKFLKSLNGDQVVPLSKFVGTVFHETLHSYVNDRKAKLPAATTPLLEKYKAEPVPVRNHIHLFAVFDETYRRLGRQKELEQLMAYDKTLNSAAVFARAREIVAVEGAANVICEISKTGCRATGKL